jgi:hypothetical protein
MSKLKITLCNRAYAANWYKNLQRQSVAHFALLQAIFDEIELKDGGDISKADMFRRKPEIERAPTSISFRYHPEPRSDA